MVGPVPPADWPRDRATPQPCGRPGPSERGAPSTSPPRLANAQVTGCGRARLPRRPTALLPVATTVRTEMLRKDVPRRPPNLGGPRLRFPWLSAPTQLPDPLTALPRGGRGYGGGGSSGRAGAAGRPTWIQTKQQPYPAPVSAPGEKRARGPRRYTAAAW